MSDKEPRRRKKRKDSQSRKDDIRSDDHVFVSSKHEAKDSDADTDEDFPVPSSQPSGFAKFVFVILFSGLVLSMSFVFISLRGSDQDLIAVSNGHTEEIVIPEPNIAQEDSQDSHSESQPWSLTDGIQEKFQDLFPKIGNILSFNHENVEESHEPSEEEISNLNEDVRDFESSVVTEGGTSSEPDVEDQEDSGVDQTEEFVAVPEIYIETSTEPYQKPEPVIEKQEDNEPVLEDPVKYHQETEPEDEFEYSSTQAFDESDFTSPSNPPVTEQSFSTESPEVATEAVQEEPTTHVEEEPFLEPEPETKEDTFPYYEKADITNEDDFGIHKELDDLEAELIKEQQDDDNDDSDDSDDSDDDYEGEEGADEFEFWQF